MFSGYAVIYKETGLVDDLKSDTNDLFEAVGSVDSGGVITAVFDPVKKGFNWLIDVVRDAEDSVVFCRSAEEMLAYVAYKWSRMVRVFVRPYLMYLCWRERMNISSTVERRIC